MGQSSDKLEKESLEALMNRPVEGRESLPAGERDIDRIEPEMPEDDQASLMNTQMLRQILGKDVTSADSDEGDDADDRPNPYDPRPPAKD